MKSHASHSHTKKQTTEIIINGIWQLQFTFRPLHFTFPSLLFIRIFVLPSPQVRIGARVRSTRTRTTPAKHENNHSINPTQIAAKIIVLFWCTQKKIMRGIRQFHKEHLQHFRDVSFYF